MAAAQPDRRVRPVDGLGRHRAALELIDAAAVAHLRLRPQRLDQLYALEEPSHPTFARDLELRVVVIAAQPQPQDRAPAAGVVERRDLVSDEDGMVDR